MRQVVPRRTHVVGTVTELKCCLRGNQEGLARPLPDRLTEDLLRKSLRIYVRGIEEIDSRIQADLDETRRLFHVRLAPGPEELASSAKRASAKTENRNLQTALS